MTNTMAQLGARQYQDALNDPRHIEFQPGIIMRPFHEPWPGHHQDWHVYCETHPEYGFCGVVREAIDAADAHRATHEWSSSAPERESK